jgi:hypothetical protein
VDASMDVMDMFAAEGQAEGFAEEDADKDKE